MKKLVLVLALAAILAPAAGAGGWATVGLGSTPPPGLEANQNWPVDVTVLQHGETPLAGVTPVVRVRDDGGKVVGTFEAAPTDRVGVYRAVVRFPSEGSYSYEVYDGFETYGGAQTHTFNPVEIAPAGSFPYLTLALALGLALVLGAATVGLLRRRTAAAPAPVTNLREAA